MIFMGCTSHFLKTSKRSNLIYTFKDKYWACRFPSNIHGEEYYDSMRCFSYNNRDSLFKYINSQTPIGMIFHSSGDYEFFMKRKDLSQRNDSKGRWALHSDTIIVNMTNSNRIYKFKILSIDSYFMYMVEL